MSATRNISDLVKVGELAVAFCDATNARKMARYEYIAAWSEFSEGARVVRGTPAFEQAMTATKSEYESLLRAKADERNAHRRLERLARKVAS